MQNETGDLRVAAPELPTANNGLETVTAGLRQLIEASLNLPDDQMLIAVQGLGKAAEGILLYRSAFLLTEEPLETASVASVTEITAPTLVSEEVSSDREQHEIEDKTPVYLRKKVPLIKRVVGATIPSIDDLLDDQADNDTENGRLPKPLSLNENETESQIDDNVTKADDSIGFNQDEEILFNYMQAHKNQPIKPSELLELLPASKQNKTGSVILHRLYHKLESSPEYGAIISRQVRGRGTRWFFGAELVNSDASPRAAGQLTEWGLNIQEQEDGSINITVNSEPVKLKVISAQALRMIAEHPDGIGFEELLAALQKQRGHPLTPTTIMQLSNDIFYGLSKVGPHFGQKFKSEVIPTSDGVGERIFRLDRTAIPSSTEKPDFLVEQAAGA